MPGDRSAGRIAESVARGYPLTVLLSVLLVFLAALAIFRKAQSLARGWTDAHVPLVIVPGKYDEVASDLDRALEAAGLEVEPTSAPAAMSKPAKWLASVAGSSASSLVPEKLIQLDGKDIDILIYPMDLLISGKPALVARARAAMASRLTTSAAHLTISAEAQAIEDRLAALARPVAETPDIPRASTTPPPRSSRRSTTSWPRSRSRTRNGRSCIASAFRSSATCGPARWPGMPSWAPTRRVPSAMGCSERWQNSAAWSGAAPARCWRPRPTNAPAR